jgi:hypothetical protein
MGVKAVVIESIEAIRQYFENGIEIRVPRKVEFGECDFAEAGNGRKHESSRKLPYGKVCILKDIGLLHRCICVLI